MSSSRNEGLGDHTPAKRARADRWAWPIGAITLACALYFCMTFALQSDVRRLLVLIVDDASYYFTAARNLAAGLGLTFDGIHPTNGFHPLWLLLLVPLFLAHGTPETMIRLVVLLQAVLLSVAYLVFWHIQSKSFSSRTAALTGILFACFVFLPSVNGMESALLVLLITMLHAYGSYLAQKQPAWSHVAVLGILIGCVILTRLDMIFVALYLFLWFANRCLFREVRPKAVARVLVCGLAVVVVVGPYLAFNFLEFGDVMPISGALKSSFPHSSLGPYTLPRLAAIGSVNLVSAGLAICWSVWTLIRSARSRPASDPPSHAMATSILAWTIATHFMYTIVFMKNDTFGWYFVLYPLFAIFLVTGPIDRMIKSRHTRTQQALYPSLAAVLMIALIGRIHTRELFPQNGQWHTPVYNAAVWAREHTPPEAIFAMSDCGHFAFFSLRRVINLDGLMNDRAFQSTLAEHRLNEYLRQNAVSFLVQHAVHGREDVIGGDYDSLALPFPSRMFQGLGDSVRVRKQSEVYRSPRFFDGRYPAILVIWSMGRD